MKELSRFACMLAEESQKIIMPYFKKPIQVDTKKDASPVTLADRKTEELMRKLIGKHFPDHGIIGEEFGNSGENAEYIWVLDPIDGTKSFICGVPLFGTLIALLKKNKPILGIINMPAQNELFLGIEGKPTTLNGKKIRVRETSSFKDAVLLCTDHLDIEKHKNTETFLNLARSVKFYRNWGDCYMYTLLARGYADIALDPIMNYWDIQALIPVIKGAGGVITSWEGKAPEKATSIIAATPKLHKQVIRRLNGPDLKKRPENN